MFKIRQLGNPPLPQFWQLRGGGEPDMDVELGDMNAHEQVGSVVFGPIPQNDLAGARKMWE